MPFEYEYRDWEEEVSDAYDPGICVEVDALILRNGAVRPVAVLYNDARYSVERIVNCRDGRELKASVPGIIFNCSIEGSIVSLLYDQKRWYIVGK